MQKKEIERKLNKMVVDSTPNVLDDVLAKCENKKLFKERKYEMTKEKKKNLNFIPKLAGALMVIVVCIGGLLLFRNNQNRVYDSIINFDVNPSVE